MEAWDKKTDDYRSSDTITNFLLFCEGENTEPLYFKHFETLSDKIKVNSIGNWKSANHNVNQSIHYCTTENMMEVIAGVHKLKQEVKDNVWCVYDRDLESTDLTKIRPQDDLEFSHSVATAKNAGLNVAWSNDIFEVWMLLHFEMIPVGQRLHRTYIYARLTEIFKTLEPRSAELDHYTGNENFSFKYFSKREMNFITHIRPRLMERTQTAIDNAIALEANYSGGAIPYHDQNPGTTVHHLVQAIQAASV